MRKLIVALGMTTAVCLSSAAVAFADGAPPPTQAATQSATTAQQAAALSSAQQVQPQNFNVSIRINSPGDDGAVTQTNSVGSTANAGNEANDVADGESVAVERRCAVVAVQPAGPDSGLGLRPVGRSRARACTGSPVDDAVERCGLGGERRERRGDAARLGPVAGLVLRV